MQRSQSCFRTLVCSAVVALAMGAPRARACDTAAQAGPESSCVVLDRHGVRGVWFRLAEADELRRSVTLLPELRLQIEKYSQMETSLGREVESLRGALDAQRVASTKLAKAVEASQGEARAAQEDAARAREELGRWWRSPLIWLSVGALAGALAGLALVN